MNPSARPLRLLVNPFAAWTDLAFKTGEMILVSAQIVAAKASARVVVIDNREPGPAPVIPKPMVSKPAAPKRTVSKAAASKPKSSATRKHKKRARR